MLLLLLVFHTTATAPPPPPKHTAVDLGAGEKLTLRGEDGVGNRLCENKYLGLGFVIQAGTARVQSVGVNTPAERAGLQPGDVLIHEERLIPGSYHEGERVPVPIKRDGRALTLTMIAATICRE
jgi:predicted metalloprotease with PDZ domain